MSKLNDLQQEARELLAEMNDAAKSLLSEDAGAEELRALTKDERDRYDKADKRFNEVQDQIKILRDTEERQKTLALQDEQRKRADFDAGKRSTAKELTEEQRQERAMKAYSEFLRGGYANMSEESREAYRKGYHLKPEYRDTLAPAQGLVSADGGITVPTLYAEELIKQASGAVDFLNVCRVYNTATGAEMVFHESDDSASKAIKVADLTDPDLDKVAYGSRSLRAHKYTPQTILTDNSLLQDSLFDIAGDIRQNLLGRVSNMMAYETVLGVGGANDPQGILTGTTQTHGAGVALTIESLYQVQKLVKRKDRFGSGNDNMRWMFNETVHQDLKILSQSGSNDFFWQPNLGSTAPATIDGVPYIVNDDMPDVGVGNKSILFGNFGWYRVRIVNGFQIKRIVDKYIEYDAVGFTGFIRWDAQVFRTGAFAAITTS